MHSSEIENSLRRMAAEVCKKGATKDQEEVIVALYRKVFRQPFSSCKCQLCDAIFLILNNLEKMENRFQLKKGIALTQFGKAYRLTYMTITDKLAMEHLRARPQDAKFFDRIPGEYLQGKIELKAKEQPETDYSDLVYLVETAEKLSELKMIASRYDIFESYMEEFSKNKNFRSLKAKMLNVL